MPQNLFARSHTENRVFRDESALYPDFLPEKLFARDREIDELVFALKPASEGQKPRNVFIYGSPGTGKTACIRLVTKQLEEYSSKTRAVLINCFEAGTRHAVLAELAQKFKLAVPKRGIGSDEIYSELLTAWKRLGVLPIIVLDEADQLLSGEDGDLLLYDLVRAFEREKIRTGVLVVSNDAELLARLDARVKSSLAPQSLLFEKYSPEQLKAILSERARLAFFSESISQEVVFMAAGHAAKLSGDCRVGIEALLAAGRLAEKQNAQQVTVEHLRSVFSDVDKVSLERRLNYLNANEREVIKLIARHPDLFSGDLFHFLSTESKAPIGERNFRQILTKLDQMGLIDAQPVTEGIKGKTRQISLKVSAEKVKSL